MNHARTAIAISALALSAAALCATQASAQFEPAPGDASTTSETDTYDWPDEGFGYPGSEATRPDYNHPNYDPRYAVSSVEAPPVKTAPDDTGAEVIQAGAGAVGGAAVALSAMWLYRRRSVPAT
jgi:hypothetical protein